LSSSSAGSDTGASIGIDDEAAVVEDDKTVVEFASSATFVNASSLDEGGSMGSADNAALVQPELSSDLML
jgi:hypothetical protein